MALPHPRRGSTRITDNTKPPSLSRYGGFVLLTRFAIVVRGRGQSFY